MDIRIIHPGVSLSNGVEEYVKDHLDRHVKKYFENAINADVHFSKQRNNFKVNIIINEGVKGGGIDIKGDAEGGDIYGCFNEAIEKISKQLQRYKDRIKNYRRERGGLKNGNFDSAFFESPKYVLAPVPYDLLEEIEEEESQNIKEEGFKVLEEKTTNIEELTVQQAIMKMDLANLPALVFINQKSKRLNVVYHRKDGNISWIDANIS